eukprot:Gb_21586 [translate_table: standard]
MNQSTINVRVRTTSPALHLSKEIDGFIHLASLTITVYKYGIHHCIQLEAFFDHFHNNPHCSMQVWFIRPPFQKNTISFQIWTKFFPLHFS